MRKPVAVLVVLIGAIGSALAQKPPTESVTVTSQKTRQAIDNLVIKLTSPTRLTGKIARWDVGICPMVTGVKPEFGAFIVQSIRETAARVGAPVNKSADCRSNIHITFTTTPQELLTNIRNTQPYMLGYGDSEASKDRLAKFRSPIQSWHTTQTRDRLGKTTFDSPKTTHDGRGVAPGMVIPYAISANAVIGGRLGDGQRSVFYNAIIVADPNALLDQEMGTVADHVAMLALAQIEPFKNCPALPSIMSLFTPGCANRPVALTAYDEGYLRGLYSMDAQAVLQAQRDQIAYKIGQSLEGR